MKVNDLFEARHISNTRWDNFRQEFFSKPYPEEIKQYLKKDPRFEQFFKEMKWSWDWWYEMCITYMEEEPEGYDPGDFEVQSIADQWIENIVDDEAGPLMDLDVYPELKEELPFEHITTITIAIARWIRNHAEELTDR